MRFKKAASMALKALAAPAAFILLAMNHMNHPPLFSSDSGSELAKSANRFSISFLKSVASDAEGNVAVSPLGIFNSFAICYIASEGETRAELAKSFGFPSGNSQFLEELPKLRKQLMPQGDDETQMEMASSLWLDSSAAKFNKIYLDEIERDLGATLFDVDFQKASNACARINEWIEEKSNGKIKGLMSPGDFASKSTPFVRDEPCAVIADAAYFKAKWQVRFRKYKTEEMEFHAPSGIVKAEGMNQFSDLSYSDDEKFKLLRLDCAGDAYSMLFLLPHEILNAKQLAELLDAERIDKLASSAFTVPVDVRIPKFSITSRFDIKPHLTKLGVNEPFDSRKANFDRMIIKAPDAFRVYIDSAKQSTFVAIDEDGAKAASATTATNYVIGFSIPEETWQAEFHADHPFIFMIVHNKTASILFAGCIVNPSRE